MYLVIVGRGVPNERYPLNGIFEFDQAKALAAYGHKVVYVSIDLRSIRRIRKLGFEQFIRDGVEVLSYNVPVGAVGNKLLDAVGKNTFAHAYKRVVKSFGIPKLVHAHFGDVAVWTADVCKKNNVPFVITEHSSAMNKAELSNDQALRYGDAYRKANLVIAVGNGLAKNIQKHTGVSAVVVPNMVDTTPFHPHTRQRKEGEPFRFLSSGSLIQSKGFDLLFKAFTLICENHEDVELRIMGDGPGRESLQTMAKELGIADRVQMTGKYIRKEFGEALDQADCFVLATRWETFGVVYIEAMAAGVPVIATHCGGPEDFVMPEDGILIPVEDVQALADAMEEMYQNIDIYDRDEIRKHVIERFAPAQLSHRLNRLYEKILYEG